MIIFAKYGEYDRRELLEECLTKYLETMKKPSSKENLPSLKPQRQTLFQGLSRRKVFNLAQRRACRRRNGADGSRNRHRGVPSPRLSKSRRKRFHERRGERSQRP